MHLDLYDTRTSRRLTTGRVHYFGEHVDNIRRGRIVDHHGSWLYGRDTDGRAVVHHCSLR